MTKEQRELIESEDSLQVCNAVAGAGKTQTMVWKVKRELQKGVKPESIICLTFTQTGAAELRERTDSRINASTLHALAMRSLKIELSQLLSEEEESEFFEAAKATLKAKVTRKDFNKAFSLPIETRGEAGSVARQAFADMKREGRFSFDAILKRFLAYLKEKPLTAEILIVDEAQDTSPIDEAIFREIKAARRVFIGDSNQSIFGFRGADPRFFRKLSRHPEATVFPMGKSWRCGTAITRVSNALIGCEKMEPADHEGQAIQRRFTSEQEQFEAVIASLSEQEGTKAILCRFNARVEAWAGMLAASSIPFQRTRQKPSLALQSALEVFGIESDEQAAETASRKFAENHFRKGILKARELHKQGNSLDFCLHSAGITRAEIWLFIDPLMTFSENLERVKKGIVLNDSSKITLGTIHGSKGSEFDRVALPDCVAFGKRADMEEERRIFYVGITRARESIFASYADLMRNPNSREVEEQKPSPFLEIFNNASA